MRLSLRPFLLVLGLILGLLGTLSLVHPAHAQFDPLGAGLGGAVAGDVAWADVDNDGDSDLLVIGNGSGSTEDTAQPSATLYENQGDDTFSPFNTGLDGVSAGSAAFGDFDDDGDPDLIITGNQGGFSEENLPENSAQIYENDGSGDFDKLNAGIEGVTVGSVDWGDVDGDGTLDVIVAGNIGGFGIIPPPIGEEPDPSVRVYEGDGSGSFSLVDAGIDEGVAAVCSSNFGDIDDDGDVDVVVAGGQGSLDNPTPFAAVYENDGTGTFSMVDAPITDVAGRTATWADVNGNANLDLILAGVEADSVQRTRLYLNDGSGGFAESPTDLTNVAGGAIAPADVDLDGDLDLALSGRDTTGSPVAAVYENDGTGAFTPFDAGLTPVEGSAAAWGDVGVKTTPDLALVGRDADSTATATIYENQIGGIAEAQFIHNAADPAANTVDVYFGNERALDDVEFRSATEFIDVPANLDIEAGIAPGGSSGPGDIVVTQTVTLEADKAHTVVANGVLNPSDFAGNPDGEPIEVELFVESEADSTAPSGEIGLRGVHGATDAPTVDVDENGTTLLGDLTYGDVTTNYSTTTAEEKLLTVTATGPDTLIAAFQADLSELGGSAATVLASGFLDPSANQDGEPFRLVAAQPNGTVTTFPLNQVPQFTSVPADFSVAPKTEIDTTIGASDPDGDALTFSAVGDLPEGASLDSSTGQFTWTPSLSQRDSTYAIGVQVTDGVAEIDTSFAVTVEVSETLAQLIHNAADPAVSAVDIYFGEEKQFDDFGFRSATSFVEVPAAVGVEVGVAPSGSEGVQDTVASQTITFSPDSTYTVVANGVLNPADFEPNPDGEEIAFEFLVESEADSTAPSGEVGLRGGHGATDAPTVDVDENGTTLLDDLTYGDVTANYLSVTAEEKRLVVTPGDSDDPIATFQADLSGLGGSAATMLASGFLDPAANQDGPAFRLIAAQPSGDVVTFAPNQAPTIANPLPDDTLETPGPPLQLIGLGITVFDDPEGDSLSFSATSSDPSVVDVVEDTSEVLLQPEGTGTTEVAVAASDGVQETSTPFQVTVEDQEGEDPVAQALALVAASGANQTFDFRSAGNKIVPIGVEENGPVKVQRFESAPSDTSGIDEENVSESRTVITAGGNLGLGTDTEVRFPVEDFTGIGDPTQVTVYSRPTPGDGTFNSLPTSVDDKGTSGDPSDDEIVATTGSFSEFVLASDTEPLPVELAAFTATFDESTVQLQWETTSETDNAGFRVQHETAQGWQTLGFVESKAEGGTTTDPESLRDYRFAVERELEPGTHRFRLQQVDLDGGTSLSDVVSVEVQMDEALTLSPPAPNPTSGPATVSFAVKEASDAEVVVYNVLGQKVQTLYEGTPRAGQSKRLAVDAGALPSGVYMVQLRADGQTKTRRLTVVQ